MSTIERPLDLSAQEASLCGNAPQSEMTFDELWPSLCIPGEFDAMDALDQQRWRGVLQQAFEAGASQSAIRARTSQKMTDAGFTHRLGLWANQARAVLELIAAPMRPDGTWNRDREACRQMAAEALGRYED